MVRGVIKVGIQITLVSGVGLGQRSRECKDQVPGEAREVDLRERV